MHNILHRTGTILSLVLLLWGGLSWAQLPPSNDRSDGLENTGGGTGALQSNTMGFRNTAYGTSTLNDNTTGFQNTASGTGALQSNTTGGQNTASGAFALVGNTEGFFNTASGALALHDSTMGFNNTASGFRALFRNATGNRNTATGVDALLNNTTGSNNIALGYLAGSNLAAGSDNIYLGHPGAAKEFNTVRLGQAKAQTRTFIAGIAGVPVSGTPVSISSAGQLGIQASSARYKRDIEPLGVHSQGLFQLRPVTFRYIEDASGERQYGLIAEEVATVYPELVIRGANGEVVSVRYEALIPLLLHELQHQQRQVAELQAENARLQTLAEQHAALAARLEQLEAAVARTAALASR